MSEIVEVKTEKSDEVYVYIRASIAQKELQIKDLTATVTEMQQQLMLNMGALRQAQAELERLTADMNARPVIPA